MEPVLPPELAQDQQDSSEPMAVLTTRERKDKDGTIKEWLIQWKNKPVEEATWEAAADIQMQFPYFCLEDKAEFSGGGIDRIEDGPEDSKAQPKPLKVYSRRIKQT